MVQVAVSSKLQRLRDERAAIDAELAAEEHRERLEARLNASTAHNSTILAGDSPSPTKRRKIHKFTQDDLDDGKPRRLSFTNGVESYTSRGPGIFAPSTSRLQSSLSRGGLIDPSRLAYKPDVDASRILTDYARTREKAKNASSQRGVARSTAFEDKAPKPTIQGTSHHTHRTQHKSKATYDLPQHQDKGKLLESTYRPTCELEDPPEPEYKPIGNRRNEDLTIDVMPELGPKDFDSNADDPLWLHREPNSGIRLRSRVLPHDELQEHLSDRYHVSPELFYSLVKPSKGGTDYEMPLEGDWIVIGVLADKSEIRMTGGGTTSFSRSSAASNQLKREFDAKKARESRIKQAEKKKAQEELDEVGGDANANSDDELRHADSDEDKPVNGKNKKDGGSDVKPTSRPRRYISFKLIDLGHKGAGSGADVLNVKIFEADPTHEGSKEDASSSDEEITKNGVRVKREKCADDRKSRRRAMYKGGSGGAYEKFWKEGNGAVVAILNPRIMKPWTSGYGPQSNIIAITPDSADSMKVIGQSEDLGSCQAKKRDGKLCGQWCDKRNGEACDYHRQLAIKSSQAKRAEFFTGTNGMKTTTTSIDFERKRLLEKIVHTGGSCRDGQSSRFKQGVYCGGTAVRTINGVPYDPDNQFGLLPVAGSAIRSVDGCKTYAVRAASTRGARSSVQAASDRIRERFSNPPPYRGESGLDPQQRAEKRRAEDYKLQNILMRDGGKSLGAKYLSKNGALARVDKANNRNAENNANEAEDDSGQTEDDRATETGPGHPYHTVGDKGNHIKRIFDISAVRRIGFDPSNIGLDVPKEKQQKMLEAMKALENPGNIAPRLGHRPGQKVRSGVAVPVHLLKSADVARLATVDDWEDLAAVPEDGVEDYVEHNDIDFTISLPTKSVDSGNFDYMFSDDETGDQHRGEIEESEDDLVIEP